MSKLFVLFPLMFALAACQQGEKKTSQTDDTVQANVASMQSISDELETHKILLKGSIPNINDTQPVLPEETLKSDQETQTVESLLERYIVTARKVQNLADDKVVNFTNSGDMNVAVKRASRYLGHIYSQREWDNEASPVSSADVDWAEYSDRSVRMGSALRGISLATKQEPREFEKTLAAFKKLETKTLQLIQLVALSNFISCNRMTVLMTRNDSWGVAANRIIQKNMPGMAQLFALYYGASLDELKSRESKK